MEPTGRGDELVRLHGKLADCLEGEHKPNGMFALALLLGQLASERPDGLRLVIEAVKTCHDAQVDKNNKDKTAE